MSERTDGWYWVKLEDSDGWIPWEWIDGRWYGSETPIEVGQRIPTPDEPWQFVPTEPTHSMLEASGYDVSIEAVEAWQAMLSAAPKPGDV